jgi:hypothetical protein
MHFSFNFKMVDPVETNEKGIKDAIIEHWIMQALVLCTQYSIETSQKRTI